MDSKFAVTKETKVLTDKGYFHIEELSSFKFVNIWNGEKFVEVKVKKVSGWGHEPNMMIKIDDVEVEIKKKAGRSYAQICTINLNNSHFINCAYYSKLLIKTDYSIPISLPVIDGTVDDEKGTYTHGFLLNECSLIKKFSTYLIPKHKLHILDVIRKEKVNEVESKLVGKSGVNWINFNPYKLYNINQYTSDLNSYIPDYNSKIKYKLNFLAGLLDSIGNFSIEGNVVIPLKKEKQRRNVFYLLQTLGVSAILRPKYLYFSGYYIKKLKELGLKTYHFQLDIIEGFQKLSGEREMTLENRKFLSGDDKIKVRKINCNDQVSHVYTFENYDGRCVLNGILC